MEGKVAFSSSLFYEACRGVFIADRTREAVLPDFRSGPCRNAPCLRIFPGRGRAGAGWLGSLCVRWHEGLDGAIESYWANRLALNPRAFFRCLQMVQALAEFRAEEKRDLDTL